MSNEQREHINKIREEFQANQRVKDSLNNSIKALADDLYSKDTHFIFELIQNAEDNEYEGVEPSILFRLTKDDPTNTLKSDGALIIQNNEVGFLSKNVDAICAVGKTTKEKAQGYIGEKGIGFKSVFRVTATPYVFSNGYQFCLPEEDEETGLGYIVPRWVEHIPNGIDRCKTTIVLPLDKADSGFDRIKEMLCDIKLETILFLSKLKEVKIDTGTKLEILKNDSNLPTVEILVNDEGKETPDHVDEFLLYTRSFLKPADITHEKRMGIKEREVSIAFLLNQDQIKEGGLYAYLPVHSDTGLPFSINADFILTSSRENIHWDSPWNKWLMRCVAKLLADALPKLKEQGHLTIKLLDAMVKKFLPTLKERLQNLQGGSEKDEFFPIADAVRSALLNQDLLPADDGSFISAKNAKLVRGAELRKLLGDKQRQALFSSQAEIKWLSRGITQDRTTDLRKYLINELDVEEVTPDDFARKTTLAFFENQSDEWMTFLYRFLNGQEALWEYGDGSLSSKDFIRLKDGKHVTPLGDGGVPNAYLPIEIDTDFPMVKPKIAQDEKALEFLKKLGLTKPDEVAEVIELIIPKYTQDHPHISDNEHLSDMKKILRAYLTDSREKKELLAEKLKEIPFIRAENPVSKQTEYKKPEELYFRNKELTLYFDGNEKVWFVSSEYDECFHDLFKKLGVDDDVSVKREDSGGNVLIKCFYGDHKRGLNGFDPNINVDGLAHALENSTIEKSLIIWRIARKNVDCICGTVESSTQQTYERSTKKEVESKDFGLLLIHFPWLPDQQGNFHFPHELKLNDLPKDFERDEKLANQLGMEKNVVAKLAEEAGISQDTLDFAQKLENQPPAVRKKIEFLMQEGDQKNPDEVKATSSKINYGVELEKAVNRLGRTEIQEQITDEGKVKNPENRREKSHEAHEKRLHDEPNPGQRRKDTMRTILEGPDEQVREHLVQWYEGKCQICNKTFPERNGQPFFVANYIVPRKRARFVDNPANALCLCADHFAKWQHGTVEVENILTQINSFRTETEGENALPIVRIKLCGEECEIKYKEKHLLDLQELLRASDCHDE